MDLYNQIEIKIKELDSAVKLLRKIGTDYAKAERAYKILLREEILKLRDEGVAVGVVDKICYGIPSVAEARFKRDVADVTYKANLEYINSTKLQLRLLDEQLKREWGTELSD